MKALVENFSYFYLKKKKKEIWKGLVTFMKSVSQFRVLSQTPDLASICLFKVKNGSTITCEIPSKFKLKTAENH